MVLSWIHTILADNGIQFADRPRNRDTNHSRQMRVDMICEANGIEHCRAKHNHPWAHGPVERMNRTIKDATVKCFHGDSCDRLRCHLADFMAAYNFARRQKALSGLTPNEYICKIWTSGTDRLNVDPMHKVQDLTPKPASDQDGSFLCQSGGGAEGEALRQSDSWL